MNNITTKFKKKSILWLLWMLLAIAGLLLFMIKVLIGAQGKEILPIIAFQLFFGSLLAISVLVLRDFKYVKVNSLKKELKFYSILSPFGKLIDLNVFIGFIKSTEFTINGEITTVHFVNNKMITQFKLSEIFYENFNEIINTIELKEIKSYDFGLWKYLQLIFTGKLKVTPKDNRK